MVRRDFLAIPGTAVSKVGISRCECSYMRMFWVEREAPEVVTGICGCHSEVRAAVAPFFVCMMFPFSLGVLGHCKVHHPIPGTAGTCSTFSGMAGTSPELISNRSEAVRTFSTSKSLCQLLLKYYLSGVQIEAGCLGRMCGMTPETFVLLVCTAESENRNNLLKTKQVL